MKGTKLFFYACLGICAFGHAMAIDGDDTARAATRRSTNQTITTPVRGAPTTPNQKNTTTSRTITNRERGTTNESRTTNTSNTIVPRMVSSRSGPTPPQAVQTRPATTGVQRAATVSRNAVTPRSGTTSRTTQNTKRSYARATVNESGTLVTNYTKCRTIFYECMDEFCAAKDANLRRCACSARSNEFNGIKKQMTNVEDKMLDFNQRLLLVNMDAEDVTTINTATEGEEAFYSTRDTTKSKRALDDIAKKLNAKFGDTDSNSSGGLGAISLTLNMDAAFDTVDSFMGLNTTSKSGIALYNAALPVCNDIAMEVCTDEELSLAQSGYQMQIEQDCNTVYKSYQTQVDQARTKVFESSALLDMSRLDAYQTRNSDDMLTCKRKMLEMLTDTTVCGAKMEKCLDMTGRYIDPTTGSAFLSVNLADLDTMITRPGVNQTWTSANSSGKFITFLNDRKKYLRGATEHCEDIADTVWNTFIEDALAQIKLAQTAKLEEIRQACTKLTAECLETAIDSIENFDARALSIFSIMADKTANTICADIKASCSTLLSSSGDPSWETGIHEISADKTYDAIVSGCTQVGRNCIIQACKSISGNFELCNDIDVSANRHSILERVSCWPEVRECVASAGDDAIMSIMDVLDKSATDMYKYSFYGELYGNSNIQQIDNICQTECSEGSDTECATCRIAERIWGNCETLPSATVVSDINHIYMPQNGQSTLLSWFAINTNTASLTGGGAYQSDPRSCVNTRCTYENQYTNGSNQTVCLPDNYTNTDNTTTEGMFCPDPNIRMPIIPTPNAEPITNCCFTGTNSFNNTPIGTQEGPCCIGKLTDNICAPINTTPTELAHRGSNNGERIVCLGTIVGRPHTNNTQSGFPGGDTVECKGTFIRINKANTEKPEYYPMDYYNGLSTPATTGTKYIPQMGYYKSDQNHHEELTPFTTIPNDSQYFIKYE